MNEIDYERQNRIQDILERVTRQGLEAHIERENQNVKNKQEGRRERRSEEEEA